MAPYAGPNIVALVAMCRRGKLVEHATLGFGIPRAPLAEKDGGFELRRLSGGEGFGVQPDLANPFVDAGVIVTTKTWQEMIAWLCEHWESDWGAAFEDDEALVVKFSGDTKAIATALHREMGLGLSDAMERARDGLRVEDARAAAAACRAARTASASVDFTIR